MKIQALLFVTALSLLAPLGVSAASLTIFDGKLSSGLDMGVNTSGGVTNWTTVKNGEMCMNYPAGQKWGAVFITVGKPTNPPRSGKDMSAYKQISLELKGKVGKESVLIGLKDASDRDDGKETRIPAANLTTSYKKFDFPLASFKSADLKSIYVPIELVFTGKPTSICVRNIQFN
jgi:hypothetical protein